MHLHVSCCWLISFTQCIIEALCQSSCCRQCMINWALGHTARVNWPPHWDHCKKPPKTHLNGHIRPQNLQIWTLAPWFNLGNWYFKIFMGNLNGLCGFYHDPNVGGQFALVGWTWPTLEPRWKSQSFWGQLQNTIDTCTVLRASPPHTCKHQFSLNFAVW